MDGKFEGIIQPKDKNTKIWRYMDFSKFEWMIKNEAIYFPNFEEFEDRWEGKFPYDNVEEMCKLFMQSNTNLTEEKALENAKNHVRQINKVIHCAGNY